jgi:hypothetical protein
MPSFFSGFVEENAEAPLSQVYENGSALEQMHSYMLLKTMRYHGMGVLLDDPETGTRAFLFFPFASKNSFPFFFQANIFVGSSEDLYLRPIWASIMTL